MITARDESVVTGIMDSNVVLEVSLGITVSTVVMVILSLFVAIVVFRLRARGWYIHYWYCLIWHIIII
jgi:hypothetical protein